MEGTKAVIDEPGQAGPPPYTQPGMSLQQPAAGYPPQPVYPSSHVSNSNTTVVIQQPQTQVVIQGPGVWSTGLCSCFDDCGVCK